MMNKFPVSNVKTKSVPAIEKGMLILEELATSHSGLSLSELIRKLALPKSSTFGLLLTLERLGYLHRNENTGRYMFGTKIFTLANMAMNGLNLRKIASPYMRDLMKRTHLTVHLTIQEQNEAVIIEKIEDAFTPKVETWIGKRMGIHCTAAGKAMISNWEEEDLSRLMTYGLPRYNENTIVSPKKLKEELAMVKKQGFSLDLEEETIGSRCIGAPIFSQTSNIVAAVSIAGYKEQIHKETLPTLTSLVKNTAYQISQALMRATHDFSEYEADSTVN